MASKALRKCVRWGRWVPAAILFQQLGCLPDDAVRQVFGENIVLTGAIIIQSLTSIFFNSLFGVA
ncbi:MAG: hypothetical protein DCC65_18205 [Planctomycetota bacterium]|nr:MAG: hypothetical protein DCC65_18205 [Planctomycetota bacterium]